MRCLSPILVVNKHRKYDGVSLPQRTREVPCGKCLACLTNLRSDWIFRLVCDFRKASDGWFVTLTFSDDNLPLTSHGNPTLDKKEFLRKFHCWKQQHKGVKYYAVGEYGHDDGRPHMHIILLNYGTHDNNVVKHSFEKYFPDIIQVLYLSERLIGYTTKYILKDFWTDQHGIKKYDFRLDDEVEEPWRVCSKGIGKSIVTESNARYVYHSGKTFLNNGAFKQRIPRYVMDKLAPKIANYTSRLNGEKFDDVIHETTLQHHARKRLGRIVQRAAIANEELYEKRYGEKDRLSAQVGLIGVKYQRSRAQARNVIKKINSIK